MIQPLRGWMRCLPPRFFPLGNGGSGRGDPRRVSARERGCAASAARAGGENCAGAAGARVRLRLARCERHELSARVRGKNASGNLRDANGCEPARVVALENERARMPTSTPRLRELRQKDVPSRARVSERRETNRGEQRRKIEWIVPVPVPVLAKLPTKPSAKRSVYRELERVEGIEPSYAVWETAVLPLNYTRILRRGITATKRCHPAVEGNSFFGRGLHSLFRHVSHL